LALVYVHLCDNQRWLSLVVVVLRVVLGVILIVLGVILRIRVILRIILRVVLRIILGIILIVLLVLVLVVLIPRESNLNVRHVSKKLSDVLVDLLICGSSVSSRSIKKTC